MSKTEALREAATDALRIFDWLARRSIYTDADMAAVHANLRAALAQQSAAPVTPAQLPERDMLRMVASAATRANEFSDDGPTQEPKP